MPCGAGRAFCTARSSFASCAGCEGRAECVAWRDEPWCGVARARARAEAGARARARARARRGGSRWRLGALADERPFVGETLARGVRHIYAWRRRAGAPDFWSNGRSRRLCWHRFAERELPIQRHRLEIWGLSRECESCLRQRCGENAVTICQWPVVTPLNDHHAIILAGSAHDSNCMYSLSCETENIFF